ncbi:MAG TPA: rhomboid family intramembrane serine protease [Candidatus Aquilonibacter sp.]|nr:rhomboid family intramembrane serine protease [Candidatus Aquilonibacter sp.]
MPACQTCGARISGFSFGSTPATECRDCLKKKKEAALLSGPSTAAAPGVASHSLPMPVVTFVIMATNIAVYLAMGLSGASWTEPSVIDAIRWGADFGPLTLGGQWWRLFTSTFVHFGIVHIALNMWCLFGLGQSLEYLMGRKAFAASYVVTGIAASTVSLWWRPWSVSAGASGAIFGIAGAFAAYVYLKRIGPVPHAVGRTGKSLAVFIVYNLVRGAAAGGVDNSAHVGGLLAGIILGVIVPPLIRVRASKDSAPTDPYVGVRAPLPIEHTAEDDAHSNRVAWGIIAGSAIVLLLACVGLRSYHIAYAKYGEAVRMVRQGRLDDAVAAMRQSVARDPAFGEAQDYLAELELERGDPQAAVPLLEAGVAKDSADMQDRQNLALADIGTGEFNDASRYIAAVVQAEKNEPSWDTIFIRGIAKGETGDFAGAIQDLQLVSQDEPNLTEARDALARYQALSKHSQDAKQIPPLTIPYSQLVVKSNYWPIFP